MTLLEETKALWNGGLPKSELRAFKFVMIISVWIACGIAFYGYATDNALGPEKGYWMAINVGYSIGTGFPLEPYRPYYVFSTVYLLFGATLVSAGLSFFIDRIAEDRDNWYTNLLQNQRYEEAFKSGASFVDKIKVFVVQYSGPLRAIAAWVIWIAAMTIFGYYMAPEWDVMEALYYAISTCSTGGLYGPPTDSADWIFAVTGFFAMIGVPLMVIAMMSLASFMPAVADLEESEQSLREKIDVAEIQTLQDCGMENNDGVIDRAEFIILCMMRMNTDPELIKFINNEFNELDKDGSGGLSVREITHGKWRFVNGELVPHDGSIPSAPVDPDEKTKMTQRRKLERRMNEAAKKGNFIQAGKLQGELLALQDGVQDGENKSELIAAMAEPLGFETAPVEQMSPLDETENEEERLVLTDILDTPQKLEEQPDTVKQENLNQEDVENKPGP